MTWRKRRRGPLPDALTLKDGTHVKDAAKWTQRRRPEIFEGFAREIYGRIPAHTPKITGEVAETDEHALEGKARMRRIVGHIDNASYPQATPTLDLTLYLLASIIYGELPRLTLV